MEMEREREWEQLRWRQQKFECRRTNWNGMCEQFTYFLCITWMDDDYVSVNLLCRTNLVTIRASKYNRSGGWLVNKDYHRSNSSMFRRFDLILPVCFWDRMRFPRKLLSTKMRNLSIYIDLLNWFNLWPRSMVFLHHRDEKSEKIFGIKRFP